MMNCASSRGPGLPGNGSLTRRFSQRLWSTKRIFASRVSLANGIDAGISLRLRRHHHQLAALIDHIPCEHRLEKRVNLEEASIKEHRHVVGNWSDDGEGLLHVSPETS